MKYRANKAPCLDQQVQVERLARTPDSQGGFAEVWSVVYTLFAEVLAQSGSEQPGADRLVAVAGYTVTIHAVDAPDLTELDRLVWNGLHLNIRRAPPAQRSVWRVLECDGGVAA